MDVSDPFPSQRFRAFWICTPLTSKELAAPLKPQPQMVEVVEQGQRLHELTSPPVDAILLPDEFEAGLVKSNSYFCCIEFVHLA